MRWQPHVTVATIVESDGKFLFVEEVKDGRTVLNQPAGHLEQHESLQQAALRETLEETQWQVELLGFSGLGLYTAPSNGITYHRNCFYAKPVAFCPDSPLDKDIERALWLSYDEVLARKNMLRGPLVLECLEHYLNGHRYPLDLIYGHAV